MLAVSLQEYGLYDPYRFGTGGPPPNVTYILSKTHTISTFKNVSYI